VLEKSHTIGTVERPLSHQRIRAPNTMSYKKPQQIRQQARETKVS
jgi:hypothetical protein